MTRNVAALGPAKQLAFASLLTWLVVPVHATSATLELPKPTLGYQIVVRLDPSSRRFSGSLRLSYKNPTGAAISRLPLHLYLNAFSNMGSTWMHESQSMGIFPVDIDRVLSIEPDPFGHIEVAEVRQRTQTGSQALTVRFIQPDDQNLMDRTLAEVELAEPLEPEQTVSLSLSFSGRLPYPFARTGCTDGFCMAAQWFPKLGVIEPLAAPKSGVPGAFRVAARQFHNATEFFADFADYDVTIDLPHGWLIGATGTQTPPPDGQPAGPRGYRRVRFVQSAVHDFAFVVGRDLVKRTVNHLLSQSGNVVAISYVVPTASQAQQLGRLRHAVEGALEFYSSHLVAYPYPSLTVVMPPATARRAAGMEYPTLIAAGYADPEWNRFPARGMRVFESWAVHELGHQYFYGLVATNEQESAFLDEGFTAYWEGRAMEALFGKQGSYGQVLGCPIDGPTAYALSLRDRQAQINEAVARAPSALFYPGTHGAQIYNRTALTLWTATALYGVDTIDRAFHRYVSAQAFTHPTVTTFLEHVHQAAPGSLSDYLVEAFSARTVPDYEVVRITHHSLDAPLGFHPTAAGPVTVTPKTQDQLAHLLEGMWERSTADNVLVEITDPGTIAASETPRFDPAANETPRFGTVKWQALPAVRSVAIAAPRDRESLIESTALVRGPGWRHLPATVLLHFEDGLVLKDRWDGTATWRSYRAVRPSPLERVDLDPVGALVVDVFPENNSLAVHAQPRFVADVGGWLSALLQGIAAGVSTWL